MLRTFAAHYAAIEGAVKITAFGDMQANEKQPNGSLALSAAAVSITHYSFCFCECLPFLARVSIHTMG